MARTIAIWGPTGLATPTCKLMLRSALTTVVETITLTEHGTVKQLYTGTVTASAGDYRFNLLTAGSYIGSGTITVSGTDGTTSEEDSENTITTTLSASAASVWSYATRTLTADGLDAISTTAPTGPASNFREMVVQTWRRFFKKATQTDTQIKTYADNGSTVVTMQTVSDDGTTETQGTST